MNKSLIEICEAIVYKNPDQPTFYSFILEDCLQFESISDIFLKLGFVTEMKMINKYNNLCYQMTIYWYSNEQVYNLIKYYKQ